MTYITRYLPAAWLDECVPPPQTDVNLFIHREEASGQWLLTPVDDDDDDREIWRTPIAPGEIVRFTAFEDYGDHLMTVTEDGDFRAPTVPAKASHFTLEGDNDTLADSLQDLVREGMGDGPLPAGTYDICAWWWSDQDTPFRFIVEDGKGRLERIEVH